MASVKFPRWNGGKPRGGAAWDKDVAWFDIALASSAFMAACGERVTLISLAVCRPENREIEAFYCVDGDPPGYYTRRMCCGGPSRTEATGELFGREAALFAKRGV